MEFPISDKMRTLRPSAIREMFKYAADPEVITMAAGSPSPEALPVEDIRRLMDEIMREDIQQALVYSTSEGHAPLREELKRRMRAEGCMREDDDLIILSGAQQCADLMTKVLCNEGDTVICEAPSFVGALNVFRSYGVNLVGVPVEEDGIDIAKLEQAFRQNERVRFLYVIPNFQNPSGITMSLAKRKACYELARCYNVAILEDDPYGELRFAGEPLPSIKTMDTDGRVFYARTFSKILSPGIRVGYFVVPESVCGKLVVAKQCTDVHTGMLSQLLCYRFVTECDLEAHITAINRVYRRKCGLMLQELAKIPADRLHITKPEGGLFVWGTLAGVEDTADFCLRLVRDKKVSAVLGSSFLVEEGAKSPSFRLTFATPTDQQIVEGVARIARLVAEL